MLSTYRTALAAALMLPIEHVETSTEASTGRHTVRVSTSDVEDPAVFLAAHKAAIGTICWPVFATHLTADGYHQLKLMPHTQPA
jgi:hypothetical protein